MVYTKVFCFSKLCPTLTCSASLRPLWQIQWQNYRPLKWQNDCYTKCTARHNILSRQTVINNCFMGELWDNMIFNFIFTENDFHICFEAEPAEQLAEPGADQATEDVPTTEQVRSLVGVCLSDPVYATTEVLLSSIPFISILVCQIHIGRKVEHPNIWQGKSESDIVEFISTEFCSSHGANRLKKLPKSSKSLRSCALPVMNGPEHRPCSDTFGLFKDDTGTYSVTPGGSTTLYFVLFWEHIFQCKEVWLSLWYQLLGHLAAIAWTS